MFRIFLKFVVVSFFINQSIHAASTEAVFAQKESPIIGIISAVPGESGCLLELMEERCSEEKGRRTYHKGKLHGIETVVVSSRIGKVAAAATVAHLTCADRDSRNKNLSRRSFFQHSLN